jgi:hypothetical protein
MPEKLTLRERILAKEDIPGEEMELPEWGETIWVRGFDGVLGAKMLGAVAATGGEDDGAQSITLELADLGGIAVACACDKDTHQPLFTADDVEAMRRKSIKPLMAITLKAIELSGLGPGASERIAGNSSSTPSESPSGE